MIRNLRSLARRGIKIPLTNLRVALQRDAPQSSLLHEATLRHVDHLRTRAPETEWICNQAVTEDLPSSQALLAFLNDYIPLVSENAREAKMRCLLWRLCQQATDETWKERLRLLIAASNFQDGVPDLKIYEWLTRQGGSPDQLGLPDDTLAQYRRHEKEYGAAVPSYFEFMLTHNTDIGHGGASVRPRSVIAVLEKRRELIEGKRVLHFAPELPLVRWFHEHKDEWQIGYSTADLLRPSADLHVDLTKLALPDASTDVIICHRVLEHILDDRAALCEMRRVLTPGGFAQLSFPEGLHRADTTEFLTVDDSTHGHVRIYGRDFPEKAADAGFDVEVVTDALEMSVEEHEQKGTYPMRIYHCWKRST